MLNQIYNKTQFSITLTSHYPILNKNNLKSLLLKNIGAQPSSFNRFFKINIINSYLFLLFIIYYFKQLSNMFKLSLFILSKQTRVYTIFKSPMAHKQWSREQFFFKHYLINVKLSDSSLELWNKISYSFIYFLFSYLSDFINSFDNNMILLYKFQFFKKIYITI